MQTFLLIKALATNHHQNGTFYIFFNDKSLIALPPLSYNYHEHKSYHQFRFVSHKLKDNGMMGPNTEACFHTKMMEQSRFFDPGLSCYVLYKHILLIILKHGTGKGDTTITYRDDEECRHCRSFSHNWKKCAL